MNQDNRNNRRDIRNLNDTQNAVNIPKRNQGRRSSERYGDDRQTPYSDSHSGDRRTRFPENHSSSLKGNSGSLRGYSSSPKVNSNDRQTRFPEGYSPAPDRHSGDRSHPPKKQTSVIGARLILFLAVFLFVLLLSVSAFLVFFFRTPDKESADMKYYYGKTQVKLSEDEAYRSDKLYLSFSKIADMLSMTKTGDSTERRFVLSDKATPASGTGKEEYVTFTSGSAECIISGNRVRLSSECVFSGEDVLVPADFVKTYMNGISVEADTSRHTVKVSREKTAETNADKTFEDAPVSFVLKSSAPPDKISEGSELGDTMPAITFSTDLSDYEKYMNPSEAYLVLVNKTKTVDESFAPDDLIPVKNTRSDREPRKMRECAAKALEALYIELQSAGFYDVSVTSSYRSYTEQKNLYASYVSKEMSDNPALSEAGARAIVDTYSAREGTSEHQTGLCCDMHNLSAADKAFAEQSAYIWLRENAWKFGFIERFPKDKTDITGYDYEPWHWRFVGRKSAYEMNKLGMCLEEYTSYISK